MKILKEIDMLERFAAGEPSVIGKTKSGKPIYDTLDHPTFKNFTKKDHEDANDVINDFFINKIKTMPYKERVKSPYIKRIEKQQAYHNNKALLFNSIEKGWIKEPLSGEKITEEDIKEYNRIHKKK